MSAQLLVPKEVLLVFTMYPGLHPQLHPAFAENLIETASGKIVRRALILYFVASLQTLDQVLDLKGRFQILCLEPNSSTMVSNGDLT